MTLFEKIVLSIIGVAFAFILIVTLPAMADQNTQGRWVAEQAYYVNSPLGVKFACRLDFWKEGLDKQEVPLICVPWDVSLEQKYIGQADGELVPVE